MLLLLAGIGGAVTQELLLIISGLLVAGVLCEVIGFGGWWMMHCVADVSGVRSFVFFVMSAICLLPGCTCSHSLTLKCTGYVSIFIVKALRGDAGYKMGSLPSYDDD